MDSKLLHSPSPLATTTSAAAPEPDSETDKPIRIRLDLSVAQVIGGSLAAATAAALSSGLGVAGTIAGAAVISMVTAVASALYTQSLLRTHTRVRAVTQVARRRTAADGTDPQPAQRQPPTRTQLRPRRLLAGGLVIFALAIAGITGFELLTGQPLSGGGTGTTLGELAEEASNAGPSGADQTPADVVPNPDADPTDNPASTAPTNDPVTTAPTPPGHTGPSPTEPTPTTPTVPSPPGGGVAPA
ncbi:MAG: hypothetical protein M3400_09795 [Actinomycetota bacterium]|nr:hypothetical protein [Actinomycetota bacterium]